MPSILGDNLVDSLVESVVDGLRESLYPAMGVRQYSVTLVRRAWSGGQVGEGTARTVSETLMSPPPLVTLGSPRTRLEPVGRMETGRATLTEVSLTFTEAELTGRPLSPGEEFYYRIEDNQGQGVRTTTWVISENPIPDREKDIGWIVELTRYQAIE